MSSPMDDPSSSPSTLGLQPSHNLPPFDPQRVVRKSALDARVHHMYHIDRTSTLRRAYWQPPVLHEPAEKQTGLGVQLATPGRVLVPSELLSEIFAYFHMEDGLIELPINRRDYPWNVAGVSSQWRRVVWSMPGGFSTIAIGAPLGPSKFSPAQVQAIYHAWLHTLSFSTNLVSIAIYPSLLSISIPYSHRIRELKLHFIDQNMLSSLFQVPPGSFDHLEELDVRVGNDGWITFLKRSAQIMPALQALFVDSNQGYSSRPALSLPWTQLTELEVTDALSANNILHILRNSQHIVRGKFRVIERAVRLHAPFTLPHLEILELSHEYPINAAHFLGPLTLPSLAELVIIDDEMGDSLDVPGVWSHQPFTALINRSHCTIRRFVLMGSQIVTMVFQEDSIEPFLRAMPAVEELYLEALVPSSTFAEIRQNGLLSELECVELTLDIAGIEEYINWLLSFEVGGDHVLEQATAFFHAGRRFLPVEQRFERKQAEILRTGIHATLRKCDCYGHSDELEGTSDNSDGEGDGGSPDSDIS